MKEIDEKLFALLEGIWTEEEKEEDRSFTMSESLSSQRYTHMMH